MAPEPAPPITRLLDDWRAGDPAAPNELVAAYRKLRRIAVVYISREHGPLLSNPPRSSTSSASTCSPAPP